MRLAKKRSRVKSLQATGNRYFSPVFDLVPLRARPGLRPFFHRFRSCLPWLEDGL